MKLRFIDEVNINGVQGHSNLFDNDKYIGILLRIKADNTAGADVDEDDCGRVRVNFRGDDIVNAGWTELRILTDLEFGRPENAAAGATWQGGIFIPFYHKKLPNAINKRVGDNMDIYIAAFGTTCAVSCVCQIYGVLEEVPELYVPKLIDYDETAAAGQIKIFIEQDNIAQVLVYEPETTAQTLLQLLVDNELMYSADWNNLTNLSNIIARIEAAALDVVVFDMINKGQIDESLSDEAVLLSTGGSGAFKYMVQSLTFNPAITIATAGEVLEHTNYKIKKKATRGKVAGCVVAQYTEPNLIRPDTSRVIGKRPEYADLQPVVSAAKKKTLVD